MFFEAEDIKNSNPEEALDRFSNVILMEENKGVEAKWKFKCLLNMIIIKCKLQRDDDLVENITQLLKCICMDKVSRNEANDAINVILEYILELKNPEVGKNAFVKILEYLKSKNYEQLWFNASLKLAKIYLEKKEYENFEELISKLKQSCRTPDGKDDPKKSSILLEIYSLEINLYMQAMNLQKLKDIYKKTKYLSSAICDPRTNAIIKDTHGRMLLIEKDWGQARNELFEAFKSYQEVGNVKAKQILKYVVLASILAKSELNPFDNLEAKVYKEDPDILVFSNLRSAFEQKNTKELNRILTENSNKIFDDTFLIQFKEDLSMIVAKEMVTVLVSPYKRVTLQYLSTEVNVAIEKLESYLQELILDERLDGKLDLVNGYFENYGLNKNISEKNKIEALESWVRNLTSANAY